METSVIGVDIAFPKPTRTGDNPLDMGGGLRPDREASCQWSSHPAVGVGSGPVAPENPLRNGHKPSNGMACSGIASVAAYGGFQVGKVKT